jgi:hypothetical protein
MYSSVIGTFISAWNLEANRIKTVYKTDNVFNIHNNMIWYGLILLLYLGTKLSNVH